MQVIQAAYAQPGLERPTAAAQVDHLISHPGAHGAAATAAAAAPGAASAPGPSSSQGSSPRPPVPAVPLVGGVPGRCMLPPPSRWARPSRVRPCNDQGAARTAARATGGARAAAAAQPRAQPTE